jgi:hypothetical protein
MSMFTPWWPPKKAEANASWSSSAAASKIVMFMFMSLVMKSWSPTPRSGYSEEQSTWASLVGS